MKSIHTKLVYTGPHATCRNRNAAKCINPPVQPAFEKAMTQLEGGLKYLVRNREPADACSV